VTVTNLGVTLSNRLGTRHTAHSWSGLKTFALHHASQHLNEFRGILECAVVHCFLSTVNVFDGAARHASGTVMVMDTVPQEGTVF
jgi:hypothetical protein